MGIRRRTNGKGRARAPLAARLACLLAAALCVLGAAGATQAYADQPGDAWILAADGSDGRDITNCDPHFVYQNGAKGEQVFCVELGYADQGGTGTSYELVGASSRRMWNHAGERIEPEWHTWTQDDVTNVALMREWAWSRFGTFRERWGYYQRMLWSYCNSNWNLDDMTTYYSFPFAEGSDDSRAVVEYVKANKSSKTGHGILYCPDNGDTTQRSIRVWVTENTGQAKLQKTSANAALTDGNPCYSLEGAVYDVYGNSACSGSAVATLTTGEDGGTDTVELAPGTYWVKERTASKGYRLCADAHEVTVRAGETATVECKETPQDDPAGVYVKKQDSAGRDEAQGDAALEGAEFTVRFYAVDPASVKGSSDLEGKTAARTWVIKTVKHSAGFYSASLKDECKVSGDDLYCDEEGAPTLPLGVAVVTETKAPAGYTAASGAAVFKIIAADDVERVYEGDWTNKLVGQVPDEQGLAAVNERVVTGKVTGVKVDSARDEAVAQGDATLEGAEVTLWNRSAASVVVGGETVEPGCAYSKVAVTDGDGNWSFGDLPYGTYEVKETKASKGYRLNEKWSQTFKVEKDGQTVELTGEAALAQDVVTGKVAGVKVDSARDEAVAQGDATLEGAEVTLWNRSAASVVVGGETVEPGCAYSKVAVTDGDGNWSFGDLPYGTYEVKETKASKGYKLNDSWSWAFEVREDGKTVTDGRRARLEQDIVRGGVGVAKVDAQRDEAVPEAAATLAGAEIEVKNVSAGSVLVDGKEYKRGEVVKTLVTDAQGRAQTAETALPYGTYELTEKTASKGYLLNGSWKATLEIREAGKVVWAESHAENGHLEEQVVRGDFNFDKVEGFSQSEMAGIPFLVTSRATGESHVVVTDENGQVDTSSTFTKHSQNTNASDAALNAEKTAVADESKLVSDGSAGVWFNGYADHEVAVDDSLGALPYDTYDVAELACTKNAGHNLVSFTVKVTRDGVNIDKGTKEDSEIGIATTLSCDGAKDAPADAQTTLTDTVQFENVARGEHTLTAEVHLVGEDGKDKGTVGSATKTFTNGVTTGSVEVDIAVDTTEMGGCKLVCFEYLDLNEDGGYAAKHEDLSDEGQTVVVPRISTQAHGDVDDEALAEDGKKLTDTVSYKNLIPGKEYTLSAELHERGEDGEDAGAVTDPSGNAVTATKTFTPQASEGSVEVEFTFDASALGGKTVVAFEELSRGGKTYATHADITDEGQDVHFPEARTHACEKTSGEQVSEAKKPVTITDAVSYTNLTPGKEYSVAGTLHVKGEDGADAGELRDADGDAVTATKTFTPEASEGSVDVEFTFDASALGGKTVVAFEELSRDGKTVATHADITDKGQSVTVETPSVPEQPETPGEELPQTGVPAIAAVLVAGGTAAAAIAGGRLVWARRHEVSESDEDAEK